jgi:4'-phosphopantetheinyl transferase
VDAEPLEAGTDWAALAGKVLSVNECSELAVVPATEQKRAFLRAWTCKEAVLKATGEGLADDLARIEISLSPGLRPRLISFRGDVAGCQNWFLASFTPAPGFIAAVAWRPGALSPEAAST